MAVGIAHLGVGTAAAAVEGVEVGWWWEGRPTRTVPSLVMPAPTVPDGGLYVAGAATGPTGVSAIRLDLDDDHTAKPVLVLRVSDTVGTPVVNACVAANRWEPVAAGPWDERPTADCESAMVVGSLAADGAAISFELEPLLSQQRLEILLVPGTDPVSGTPAMFSAAFVPPDSESLTSSGGAVISSPAVPARPGGSSAPPPDATPGMEWPSTFESPAPVGPRPSSDSAAATPAEPSTPTASSYTAPVAAAGPLPEQFAYPAVLFLPLLLLVLVIYLGRSLTCSPLAAHPKLPGRP